MTIAQVMPWPWLLGVGEVSHGVASCSSFHVFLDNIPFDCHKML